jgi:hypothetical protein
MIEICNLMKVKPSNKWDFIVSRGTPLGNNYYMAKEKERDQVCDQYENWFYNMPHGKAYFDYLTIIITAYKKYGKLRLFCWCAPKRCHAETVKRYVEEQIAMDERATVRRN